jgi:acetoin utilization deacetylase AcuC-like enzyme
MKTAYITHPEFYLHDMGHLHPESPDRLIAIDNALKKTEFSSQLVRYNCSEIVRKYLLLVHDEEYLKYLESHSPKNGLFHISMDTAMNKYTLGAALKAAGALILAVDLIMQKEVDVAFCAVRPPGHHAERSEASGFCFFNNIAIGAAYVMKTYHLSRILIVDFDVHHGNGTEYMFENDKRVLICSCFEHPQYPGKKFQKQSDHIVNVTFASGTGSNEFRKKIEESWFQKIIDFKPEFIFISAGFDAHRNDPLGEMELEESDYIWLTEKLVFFAKKYAQGRLVSSLEGGYDLDSLASSVVSHLQILVNS